MFVVLILWALKEFCGIFSSSRVEGENKEKGLYQDFIDGSCT